MLHIEHLLMVLCQAEVAFIVIGGMAAVAQGSAYVTADLDLCYQRHPPITRPGGSGVQAGEERPLAP